MLATSLRALALGLLSLVLIGAACINVAAGYPCNVHLSIVGDFEL